MFSLFCRPDERSGGRVGNKRKIRIRLDPAQYYADMRVRSPSCHSSMILMSCHHYFFLTTALKFLICTTTCLYIFCTMEDTSEYDQLPFSLWDTLTFPVSVHILFLYPVLYLDLWMYSITPIVKRTLLPWGLLVALAGNITNRGESWKKCGRCLHWLYACFYPNAPYISIL